MSETRVDYHTDPDRYVASFCRIGGHIACQTRGIFRCACACHQEVRKDEGDIRKDEGDRGAVHHWLGAHESGAVNNRQPRSAKGKDEESSGGT